MARVPLVLPFNVEIMIWQLLSKLIWEGQMSPSLLVKGGLSCKSEWVVGRSTCSLTVGIVIFGYTERQRRSVFPKLNGKVMVRVYPW